MHDITGFAGRCDAIFLSREEDAPPEGTSDVARTWRRQLRNLPQTPTNTRKFDVVIIGGGIVGSTAALVAARLGERVALIHNRPYLGGNASVEIGLRPRGVTGPLIDEISNRTPSGDLHAYGLLMAEHSVQVFLEHTVYNVTRNGSTLISVDARDSQSGKELRFTASTFIDCSGRALFGELAGAETLFGQESQAEYHEPLAPLQPDMTHHGNTLFFRTRQTSLNIPFPQVPWATHVAKDFTDLRGQLVKPGVENGPGPVITPPDPNIRRRMKGPLTHFWEYGQHLDPYKNGEHIRDHLLRAIYGTFSNVKTMEPDTYTGLKLDWVAFVAAQGEFRGYRGDHVLTEMDIRQHVSFPDAVVKNGGAFCLHYAPPAGAKYDFRLQYWEWDERDKLDYDVPFRCLYSKNIGNLMMAGKHISVTHIAGSNTKFMGNGGQHAVATAVAAWLSHKYHLFPKELGIKHIEELKAVTRDIAEKNVYPRKGKHETSKL